MNDVIGNLRNEPMLTLEKNYSILAYKLEYIQCYGTIRNEICFCVGESESRLDVDDPIFLANSSFAL